MSTSYVNTEMFDENKNSIQSFLSESYSHARRQLDEGVHRIQEGISTIRDEFSAIYGKTGEYLHRMASPVNNFLKDLSQIDNEILAECSRENPQPMLSLDGQLVPVDQVLKLPMEENY
jgi:hypothetical protein